MSPDDSARWQSRATASAVDGTQINVLSCGAGEPIVLLHGWTLDHRSFNAQLPLAGEFELISFDRRGCGESNTAPNLAAEPEDIDTVLDSLGHESVHLLGVSQGARIALRYAAAKPGRLRSLILQGAVVDGYVAPVEDEDAIPLTHYAKLIARGALGQMQNEWLAHPLMASDTLTVEEKAALDDMVRGYWGQDLLAPPGPAPASIIDQLANLNTPTLIITGERETDARKAHAEKLRQTMPRAQEMILTSCGHLSNLSRPDAYNLLLKRFINSLSP